MLKTESLSLELFNHAAADLDKKGEIEFEWYKSICSIVTDGG